MQRLTRYLPSNSSLWLLAAAMWLTATLVHAVTATFSTRPSVFYGLSGVTLTLAWLSWFVSRSYRDLERIIESTRSKQRSRENDSAVESVSAPLEFRSDNAQTSLEPHIHDQPNNRHESARTV